MLRFLVYVVKDKSFSSLSLFFKEKHLHTNLRSNLLFFPEQNIHILKQKTLQIKLNEISDITSDWRPNLQGWERFCMSWCSFNKTRSREGESHGLAQAELEEPLSLSRSLETCRVVSLVHCAWCDGPMVQAIPNFVSKNDQHFPDSRICSKNMKIRYFIKKSHQSANPV